MVYFFFSILLININIIFMKKFQLIISRHGESIWNKSNRFTGWSNISLTSNGRYQSYQKALILKNNNLIPNKIISSTLIRSINTAEIIKSKLNNQNIIETSWRLNERHYGMFEGMDRDEAYKIYSKEKIQSIRKKFYYMPYIINNEIIIDKNHLMNDNIQTPIGESNNMVYKRVYPYWENEIKKYLEKNRIILIISHKNSIRCLMKIIENLSVGEFDNTNIENNDLLLYNFDENFRMISKFNLY